MEERNKDENGIDDKLNCKADNNVFGTIKNIVDMAIDDAFALDDNRVNQVGKVFVRNDLKEKSSSTESTNTNQVSSFNATSQVEKKLYVRNDLKETSSTTEPANTNHVSTFNATSQVEKLSLQNKSNRADVLDPTKTMTGIVVSGQERAMPVVNQSSDFISTSNPTFVNINVLPSVNIANQNITNCATGNLNLTKGVIVANKKKTKFAHNASLPVIMPSFANQIASLSAANLLGSMTGANEELNYLKPNIASRVVNPNVTNHVENVDAANSNARNSSTGMNVTNQVTIPRLEPTNQSYGKVVKKMTYPLYPVKPIVAKRVINMGAANLNAQNVGMGAIVPNTPSNTWVVVNNKFEAETVNNNLNLNSNTPTIINPANPVANLNAWRSIGSANITQYSAHTNVPNQVGKWKIADNVNISSLVIDCNNMTTSEMAVNVQYSTPQSDSVPTNCNVPKENNVPLPHSTPPPPPLTPISELRTRSLLGNNDLPQLKAFNSADNSCFPSLAPINCGPPPLEPINNDIVNTTAPPKVIKTLKPNPQVTKKSQSPKPPSLEPCDVKKTTTETQPKQQRNSPQKQVTDPMYKKPFDYGWRRELVYRYTLNSTKGMPRLGDIYYYAPTGERFRSMVELSKFNFDDGLTLDHFSYFPAPTGVNDIWKETIRVANRIAVRNVTCPNSSNKTKTKKRSPRWQKDLELETDVDILDFLPPELAEVLDSSRKRNSTDDQTTDSRCDGSEASDTTSNTTSPEKKRRRRRPSNKLFSCVIPSDLLEDDDSNDKLLNWYKTKEERELENLELSRNKINLTDCNDSESVRFNSENCENCKLLRNNRNDPSKVSTTDVAIQTFGDATLTERLQMELLFLKEKLTASEKIRSELEKELSRFTGTKVQSKLEEPHRIEQPKKSVQIEKRTRSKLAETKEQNKVEEPHRIEQPKKSVQIDKRKRCKFTETQEQSKVEESHINEQPKSVQIERRNSADKKQDLLDSIEDESEVSVTDNNKATDPLDVSIKSSKIEEPKESVQIEKMDSAHEKQNTPDTEEYETFVADTYERTSSPDSIECLEEIYFT